jgi:hypothetical protein
MSQPETYTDADMDPAFRRRRLRLVKKMVDAVPSARIPELENFVCRLLPHSLFEDLKPSNELKDLARGWPVPANLREIETLGAPELSRLLLLAAIMQQPPEDKSRDWAAVDSLARAALGRRGLELAPDPTFDSEQMAEMFLDLWNDMIADTTPGGAAAKTE